MKHRIDNSVFTCYDTLMIRTYCLDKERVRNIILSCEEEAWHIIGDDDNKKAREIIMFILKELEL